MATATKSVHSQPKVQKANRTRPNATGEVRDLRQRYRISQALLARLVDVSLRTISAAESEGAVPAPLRRNVTQVNRLCGALAEAMEPAFVGNWLDQPDEMLGGLKPIEAIERGQLDLVWQVAEGLRSGSQV